MIEKLYFLVSYLNITDSVTISRYLLLLALPSLLGAATIVNPPLTTTNRVIVNVVRTVKVDGTKATAWGDDKAVEFYIKGEVDRILNQSGIDVQFTAMVDYVNDFAYDGSPTDYSSTNRPTGHLNTIVDTADAPEFTDVDVINLYFVEIVPGFSQTSNNTANGLAFVDGNGITMHVGSNLLGFTSGRDVIAGVLAHEIGHNLGLSHSANGISNLMSPNGDTEQLDGAQTTLIFTDDFAIDGADFAKPLADTSYSGWAIDNSVSTSTGSDDDGDGISNLLEFALGLDPGRKDASRMAVAEFSTGPDVELQFNKQTSALDDGVIYSLEVSDSLSTWDLAGGIGTDSTLLVDTDNQVHARAFGANKAFMRLALSAPASAMSASAYAQFAHREFRYVDPTPVIYPCLIEETVYPPEVE